MDIKIRKVSENIYEIPQEGNMNVPVRIYASESLLEKMKQDKTLIQGKNVATLPGIQKYSIVMPDGHEGYGFPVGGVAAFDINEGIISPGGIGYDINCGVRLIRTNLKYEEIKPKLRQLVDEIFRNVPAGVGETGKIVLSTGQFREAVEEGLDWSYREGYAWKEDLKHVESYGRLKDASIEYVSDLAIRRGIDQLGTLGSGNHFLEIQIVDKIFDKEIAKVMGIEEEGQVTILIHTGSRGFGHQIASDYIDIGMKKYRDLVNKLPDRELVYLPFQSEEGQRYWKSMSAAANFAWNNRQMITYWVRKSFERVFNHSAEDIGLNVVYDVAHNIAKIEEHKIDGKKKKVIVHRKGATRAFPAGSEELVEEYRKIGQPVLIPGSMGTASYVLLGMDKSMELTFGSSAHGAGRNLSRAAAKRQFNYNSVIRSLEEKGILVRSTTKEGVVEEVPEAYKNVDEVAKVTQDL
ncbi:MAG: RtcB family protein, partial [Nanopusillaceae archaeon]